MAAQPASSGGGGERSSRDRRGQPRAQGVAKQSGAPRAADRLSVPRPGLAVGGGGTTSPLHASCRAEGKGGALEA